MNPSVGSLADSYRVTPRDPYQYTRLPSHSSFRLLELLPGQKGDELSYNLHVAEIGASRPYEALSYAWGDASNKNTTTCEGRTLQISISLCESLKALRHQSNIRWLWADAICIDQASTNERNHQVRHMLEIYRTSTRVIIWLGADKFDKSDQSLAQKACNLINEITVRLLNITADKVWKDPTLFFSSEVPQFAKTMPPDRKERVEVVLQNLHMIDDLAGLQNVNEYWLHGHPNYPALVWLFSRPWFQRLWVIQEVNATNNVTALCGTIEISWDRIGLVATYISTAMFEVRELELLFQDSLFHNADIMRHRIALQHWSVHQLMYHTSTFHATDPKDHIYAKLGLLAFTRSGMSVEADYNKSVKDVYKDFTILTINCQRNLDLLSFAGSRDGINQDIPSWIPQWDRTFAATSILIGINNSLTRHDWNTDGSTLLEIPLRTSNDFILVKGLVLDNIHHTVKLDRTEWRRSYPSNKHNPLFKLWRQEEDADASRNGPKVYDCTGDSLFHIYAASIVAGIDSGSRQVSQHWDEFKTNISSIIKACALAEDEQESQVPLVHNRPWADYRSIAAVFSTGRVVFETSVGYVGLGPESLEKNDLVCILYGGHVPYILRPENDYFKLVGESYVHGMMNGEAITMSRDGQLKEQDFEIR